MFVSIMNFTATIMRFLQLLIFVFIFSISFSQKWGVNTESEFTNEAMDVETDAAGNSYVCGYITGETAFNNTVIEQVSSGNGEIYISKYSSNGSLIWIKRFGGSQSDRAVDLALDQNNNIYITGDFYGQVDFDSYSITSASNSKDIFLLKLDNNGNVLWVRKEGGNDSENAYGLTIDSQDNVILTGQFSGTSSIAGQTFVSTIDPISNLSTYDLFLSKYDTNGTPLWVKVGQGIYENRGLAVAVDNLDNIFLVGQFSDTMQFAGQQINNAAYNVGFLAKFQPNGQFTFLNRLFGGMVMTYDLEVNSLNEVVVVGDYLGTLLYEDVNGTHQVSNSFSKKVFALMMQNDGSFIWGTAIGSENTISARSISISATKEIYITGYFSCSLSEFHDTQTAVFNSVGFKDVYLWKLNYQGNFDFIKQFGSKKDDVGHGVAMQNSSVPIICGSYTEDLNVFTSSSISYSVSQTNQFNFIQGTGVDPAHVYLSGDISRNSFLLNAVDSYTPQYNYFFNQPNDSLTGFIYSVQQDSTHGCLEDLLVYNTMSYSHVGPAFNYLWNTGDTLNSVVAANVGTYTVDVERIDGCSSGFDSIPVYVLPQLPTMSDDLGLAIQEVGANYYNYHFCYPDTVNIWFEGLHPSYSIEISNSNSSYFDTLIHPYSYSSNVLVQDTACSNVGHFLIDYDYSSSYDVDPYMVLVDNIDFNDSITICENENVLIQILDSLENPNGTFGILPLDTLYQYNWQVNGFSSGSQTEYELVLTPTTTGWYNISYLGTWGYINLCGIDTMSIPVTDSFYIEVLPAPIGTTSISGDNLLCPNGSVYLTLTNTLPGLSWTGPGITWMSSGGDSIQASVAGTYSYSGDLIDTVSGCTVHKLFSFSLIEKPSPTVHSNPVDAIICPYDSVYMWVDSIYLSYEWEGPTGNALSFTNSHTDDEQGFYFCVVEDSTGCFLTTPPLEIREYVTPYIIVEPTNVICENETLDLHVISNGDAIFQWTTPITSNASNIQVNQPGWYVCEIEQCGITTIDSLEIIDGSFNVSLTTNDSILCFEESTLIFVTPGLTAYEWSSGEFGISTIFVENEGEYFVEAMNSYGCTAVSDTIFVNVIDESIPPSIADLSICYGEDATLTDNSGNITNWFLVDSTFILNSNSIQLANVIADTSLLVAYEVTECPNVYSDVSVFVIDSISNYSISGDSIVCENSSTILTVNSNNETIQWFLNGNVLSDSTSVELLGENLDSLNEISVVISNPCFSDTLFYTIDVLTPSVIDIEMDSIIICEDEMLVVYTDVITDSMFWSGDFGEEMIDTLVINTLDSDGYIFVNAIDVNGCETNIDSVFVSTSHLVFDIYNDFGLNCIGDSVLFGVQTTSDSIVWDFPIGASSFENEIQMLLDSSSAGVYNLSVWDENGCMYTDSILIDVNNNPLIDLDIDSVICARTYISIFDTDGIDYSFYGFNDADSILIAFSQEIIITAQNYSGCSTTDTIFVDVVDCDDELPNVITANNDGVNDYFVIDEAKLYPNNQLTIINRWGSVVFDEKGYQNTFNGLDLSDGVYFYVFYYDYRGDLNHKKEGYLTLVRD